MRKWVTNILIGLGIITALGMLISLGSVFSIFGGREEHAHKESILLLELDGIIIDGKTFLENLKKYRDDKNIKGILVQINSPGGVVGPSQEIYSELKRVREELQKPVVVSCNALAASGGYYAAVAADKIITNPGTLMGSIGVIMEFANLENLYDWAKIKRYSIKTGAFKDAGADYRGMTEDERALFQETINQVHEQFKTAVQQGRKLSKEVVEKYADGRILTGELAVKLGFADQLGTLEDALRVVGEMAGIGGKPEVFKPPKERENILDFFMESQAKPSFSLEKAAKHLLPMDLMGQPLYLMPGTAGF